MRHLLISSFLILAAFALPALGANEPRLRAGAAAVDVSPTQFPVIINGGFLQNTANQLTDPLHARALVLDDGTTRLAIVVVDSCAMPRSLLDEAKGIASKSTGIPADRMLISATHTHTAPAAMPLLGTPVDPNYPPVLKEGIVAAIEKANANLAPATAAWAVTDAADYTAVRRFIRRPDRILRDPFGELTVRANMHPGYASTDAIGPSGPEDQDLTILSIRHADGRPLAVLGNFAMHYFSGVKAVSADYFGVYARKVAEMVEEQARRHEGTEARREKTPVPPFVAIMSQGTSGDVWRADYSLPKPNTGITIEQFSHDLAKLTVDAIAKVEHRGDLSIAMAETDIPIKARAPSPERIEWAKKIIAEMGDRLPKNPPEVYAREVMFLQENPELPMKLQAIRIGELGITALPNEVYALTGIRIKEQSPLRTTMNISLANDELGYIPPPEQHNLGGYTTWAARSSYPDVDAEPKMIEEVLRLLSKVSGVPRRPVVERNGLYGELVLNKKPLAFWRGGDIAGPTARDVSGNGNGGTYEDGVVFYLDGPQSVAFCGVGDNGKPRVNRSPHYAGGRMRAEVPAIGSTYTVELWFWNGMPAEARPVAGYLFSRGKDGEKGAPGDHLGIGGAYADKGDIKGRLVFYNGDTLDEVHAGRTVIEPRTWNHVAYVRTGNRVTVYLNGDPQPEIAGALAEVGHPADVKQLFIGGRSDNFANFEGKIDEVAVYGRALTAVEIAEHYRVATRDMPKPPAATTKPAATQPSAAASPLRPSPPKSPADSMKAMHIKPGYEVQLVAAEPLVLDPVSMAFAADGRMWVAEMADYPYGTDGKMKPSGRVRVLADTNGDGVYDKSTLFAEELNFPNGVMPWRKGVLVSAAPDILFLEDTDGDGKADVRKVLYTGFTQGNPQLRVNGFAYGLDNWIYVANGLSSQGKVKSLVTGKEIEIGGRDLRIQPDTGDIEAETGATEFGRVRSDWGDWFGCHNSHPIFHFVIADRYIRRNPHAAPPKLQDYLGLEPNPVVYPKSRPQKRYHSVNHDGHYTSACGLGIYRDETLLDCDLTGRSLRAFTCEPVHNLVQHHVVTPRGYSFEASHAADEKGIDILASEDEWFRPTSVTTGPDGALYIADMYRYMIEHPDWLPQQGKDELRPFYRLGEDRGRIYRLVRTGQTAKPIAKLDTLAGAELVASLESPNGVVRDLAQQLLIWRGDKAVAPALDEMATRSKDSWARLHALATLAALDQLDAKVVGAALSDQDPAVRRFAVALAEPLAPKHPALLVAACRLADDGDAQVRLQLACTLGEWDAPEAGAALGKLAATADDPYLAAAVMSSASKHVGPVVTAVLASDRPVSGGLFRDLLVMALARGERDVMAKLLGRVLLPGAHGYATPQLDAFSRFLDALASQRSSLAKLAQAKEDELSILLARAPEAFAAARKLVPDATADGNRRIVATTLLGRESDRAMQDTRMLADLLSPRTATDLQEAAVKAIARTAHADAPALLTQSWRGLSPRVRNAVADSLLAKEPSAWHLLQEIQAKRIAPAELDAARQQRLTKHASQRVRTLASQLFGDMTSAQRQQVIDAYRPALAMTPDAKRGAPVFAQHCATCHRVGAVGNDLGPNLRSVAAWPAASLLEAILDPNRQAEPRYLGYTATLNSGEAVFGVIIAETGNSITLKGLDGVERAILRADIRTLECSNRSLMPDGLEAAIDQQGMADLIRYLQSGG